MKKIINNSFKWIKSFIVNWKGLITLLLSLLIVQSSFAWGYATRDVDRQSSESPAYYLGDKIKFHWVVNGTGWGASYKRAGIGTTNSSAGMNWQNIHWVHDAGDGYGNNEGVSSSEFQVTSVATWYYSMWLGWGSSVGDNGRWYNGNSSWNDGSSSFISSSFTVNALQNPTEVTNTVAQNSITLNWTKWNSKNVMIVRYARGATVTNPTQGTAYSLGNTLGSGGNQGTVVYNGSATTTTIHVVPSTNYDYYFYSENYSYYSAGVKAEVNSAAINNPSSPTVSVSGTTATLGWAKNAAANDVMIVRYAKGATPTAPTQGTTYNVNNTLGSGDNQGTVIYRGNATSTTNTISAGDEYDYYFYSENWSYYSTGEVKATISKLFYRSTSDVNFTSSTNWETSTTVDGTYTPASAAPSAASLAKLTISTGHKLTVTSALTTPSSANFIVNGSLEIQSGGSVSTAPTYGSASTLIYNTGGISNRAVEWSANATSGAGYPANIEVNGTTVLRVGASKDDKYYASGALTIASDATFDTYLGTAAPALGEIAITFNGNITNNGTIQWGSGGNMAIKCASLINNGTVNLFADAGGADLHLTGNLTNNATLNYNGRAIIFVGNGNTQTIGGTSDDPFHIPFLVLDNTGGILVLNKSIIAKGYSSSGDGWWAIDIQNGTLDLNGHSITVGEADKIGNIRTATDGKIKGNVGSNITIYGKKNGTANGTLRIDNSNPGSSNVFNSFVYERTDGDNNFVITGNMTIGNLLDIKRGSVQALNNVDLLAGATGRLSSTNTSAALTVDNLILGKSSTANAQFYRNGRPLTVGNKVKVKVSFDQTGKWHFIAFPFAISSVEKSDGTAAVLGTDYTLGQYNATKRAQRISGWESSTDNPMTALKGYIINRRNTGPDNKDLYFVTNEIGAHAAFAASNNLALSYTTHTGGLNVNFGWNFVAHPLVANGSSTLAAGEFYYGYDGATDQYTLGYGASGERRSFDAYFIKTAAPGNLTVNLSAPQGAPRRTTVDGGSYQLALHHNNMEYQSHIRMHEAATFAYDELYDAPYSTPWNATTARFYSFAGNETMALNTVGGEGVILLGARFPSKGSYKISWAGNMPGYIAQLVDMSSGEITDMRYNNDYSFEANAGDINNRFKVVLSSDVSTNNKIYINNLLYVNARSNTLHIEGTQQGDRIKLYDSTGREIHQQTATNNAIAIGNLPKGIYIINIEQNEGIWRRKVVMQ